MNDLHHGSYQDSLLACADELRSVLTRHFEGFSSFRDNDLVAGALALSTVLGEILAAGTFLPNESSPETQASLLAQIVKHITLTRDAAIPAIARGLADGAPPADRRN